MSDIKKSEAIREEQGVSKAVSLYVWEISEIISECKGSKMNRSRGPGSVYKGDDLIRVFQSQGG